MRELGIWGVGELVGWMDGWTDGLGGVGWGDWLVDLLEKAIYMRL